MLERIKRFPLKLTLRGILILSFLLYLIFNPVFLENDIVAAVLAISAISVILLLLFVTLLYGLHIKAISRLSVHPPTSTISDLVTSEKPVPFIIKSEPFRILPLFEMHIELCFVHSCGLLCRHKLTGFQKVRRIIREDITFPHRGVWQISALKMSFGDQLGLACFNWNLFSELEETAAVVQPPYQQDCTIPILSSFSRSGDTIPDLDKRRGDYFDLKQYHPADGIKKIVWKIFAKSRDLISRHPERAMTPEGQVAIFCLASRKDDPLCSHTLAYLRMLEELELNLFFGCQGMRGFEMAQDAKAAETLLIETVWQDVSLSSTVADLQAFLDGISESQAGRIPDKILIFCSANYMDKKLLATFQEIGEFLEGINIKPVFLPVSTEQGAASYLSPRDLTPPKKGLFFSKYFIEGTDPQKQTTQSEYPQFMNLCLKMGWEVIS